MFLNYQKKIMFIVFVWFLFILSTARIVSNASKSFSLFQKNTADSNQDFPKFGKSGEIRWYVTNLIGEGKYMTVIEYLKNFNQTFGHLDIDNMYPSLYNQLGIAYYSVRNMVAAHQAFTMAVAKYPNDSNAWMNKGEVEIQTFRLKDAIKSFGVGFHAFNLVSALPRILRTKGWSCDWENMELYSYNYEKYAKLCEESITTCGLDSTGGGEYSDVSMNIRVQLSRMSQVIRRSRFDIRRKLSYLPVLDMLPAVGNNIDKVEYLQENYRLKVGFISSDFGVHPVSSLIRGLTQYIDRSVIELYCFSLRNEISWWSTNISQSIEHFIYLKEMDTQKAASFIASHKIDILIDLNGHTMYSGLNIMSHRPAHIQMSYLGLPDSTASEEFINYYLADYVTVPPEHERHYAEKLILMHPSYIVNDYAQLQGSIVHESRKLAKKHPKRSNSIKQQKGKRKIEQSKEDSLRYMTRNYTHRQLGIFKADYSKLKVNTSDLNYFEFFTGNDSTGNHTPPSEMTPEERRFFERYLDYDSENGKFILSKEIFIMGTLSNSQKLDVEIVHVWFNLLRAKPKSVLVFMKYPGLSIYGNNLLKHAAVHGIDPRRLIFLDQNPWIDHIFSKTSIDLLLDSKTKNGHTTGLDGIWAGVPCISLLGGTDASRRAAESFHAAMRLPSTQSTDVDPLHTVSLSISLKQYEENARKLILTKEIQSNEDDLDVNTNESHHDQQHSSEYSTTKTSTSSTSTTSTYPLLNTLRQILQERRLSSRLFDTRLFAEEFAYTLQATFDLSLLTCRELYRLSCQQNLSAINYNKTIVSNLPTTRLRCPNAARNNTSSSNDEYSSDHDSLIDDPELTESLRWSRLIRCETYLDEERNLPMKYHLFARPSVISTVTSSWTSYRDTHGHLPVDTPMNNNSPATQRTKVFKKSTSTTNSVSSTTASSASGSGSDSDRLKERAEEYTEVLPEYLFDGRLILLNIGGTRPAKDWILVNAQPVELSKNYLFKHFIFMQIY